MSCFLLLIFSKSSDMVSSRESCVNGTRAFLNVRLTPSKKSGGKFIDGHFLWKERKDIFFHHFFPLCKTGQRSLFRRRERALIDQAFRIPVL